MKHGKQVDMKRTNVKHWWLGIFAGLTFIVAVSPWVLGQPPGTEQSKQGSSQKPRQLLLMNKPWTGDFDQMLERRMIRVLAPYSRSLYF